MSFGKAKKHNNKIHIGSRAFDVFLIVFMIIECNCHFTV